MTRCPICNNTGYYTIRRYSHRYACTECKYRSAIKYAGIAPADTPEPIIAQMKMLGGLLGSRGIILRALPGTPFEDGAESISAPIVLRTGRLDQVLHGDLGDQPVSFVVCYGDAPTLAGAPVFDLSQPGAFTSAAGWGL